VYTAIDIGTTKVCTLVAQLDANNQLEVMGVGIAPSRGMQKGMVVDLDAASDAIRTSVQRAERTSGRRIGSALVGITGSHVQSVSNTGTMTITRPDRLISEEDVERVIETARTTVAIPANREIIHVIARSFTLDGQEGIRNPVGLHGFRLDVEAHIITGAVSSIQNLTKCLDIVGIRVENLVLEPLASAEAVLTEDEKEAGVALVDIGGGTSDVAVFVAGSVTYTAVLPVGGHQFTQDLVIGLRTPQAAAEEAKTQHGSVDAASVPPEEMLELSMFGHGDKRQAPHRLMNEILRMRATELLELVQTALRRSGYEAMLPAGVVFTGGGSSLQGLMSLAEDVLRSPVRVGAPEGVTGLIDTVSGPSYATSVGLLLWALRYESGGGGDAQDTAFDLAGMLRNLFGILKSRWAAART
jgi:cell division protein FtsA